MDYFTHNLIGFLLSYFTLKSLGLPYIIFAGIMAILPDFDVFLEPIKNIRKSKLLSHKGISHSFFGAFIISALGGGIFSIIVGGSYILSWIIGFLFYSLHVILDFLAASKIPLFYPFSRKKFRFFIDRAINPFLAIISGVLSIFSLISYLTSPVSYFSLLTTYLLGLYLVYFSYKLITKIWLRFRLPKNQRYIPGFLPFVYTIYENQNSEEKQIFKLTKRYQFTSKTIELIHSEIKNDSKEIDYYQKARALSNEYIFFSKWEAIIPIIWEEDAKIKVILFLAEGYAYGRAYSLRITYDKKTGVIIEKSEGFELSLLKK